MDSSRPEEYMKPMSIECKEPEDLTNKIVMEAVKQLGNKKYARIPATKNGRLACAAFVSGVLRDCGAMKGNGSLGQRNLERILRGQGWKEVWLEDAEPGDVIFWDPYPGRFHGHVGIIYKMDKDPDKCVTIDNSSSRGYSIEKKLNMVRPIRCVLRKVDK